MNISREHLMKYQSRFIMKLNRVILKNYFLISVLIETTTVCNRKCSYCPNSIFDRGKHLMSRGLFRKIINDLKDMNFKGSIGLYSYGEPLLDNRIVDFVRCIREQLPPVHIKIATNGDFLTSEILDKLGGAGTDEMTITEHEGGFPDNSKQFLSWLKNNYKGEIKILFKKYTSLPVYNRGGLIDKKVLNRLNYIKRPQRCYNPLVINYKGDVILCCNDYFGSVVFGNLKNQSLSEIWNSKKYKEIREQLRKHDYRLEICKKCMNELKQKSSGCSVLVIK